MKKVHLGDKGETSLVGKHVGKDDSRVEAYGTIDELNSAIGLAKSMSSLDQINSPLEKIQEDLFVIGADLSNVTEKGPSTRISDADVIWLEKISDSMETEILPIKKFVLPNGSQLASALHLARSVCRRAERMIVSLSRKENVNPEIIRYVNRLSDVLFVMARLTNQKLGVREKTWGPEGLLGI
jgi:cob(I)alamin adenosyltransferase